MPSPKSDYCYTVRPGERIGAEVAEEIAIGRADLLFLVDNSHSMDMEITRIAERLESVVVPGVREIIPDAEFGLSLVADFGPRPNEHPYQLLEPITANVQAITRAAAGIALESAGDPQEAQLEGLYQVATGEGLAPTIPPGPNCPPGRIGGVCFRSDATRLVLLFTDAEMRGALVGEGMRGTATWWQHRQPREDMFVPYVRFFEEAADALNALNIRVLGMWSGLPLGPGRTDLDQIVSASGAVDENGDAIVFEIGEGGETLDTDVVSAIEQLAASARPNVFLRFAETTSSAPAGFIRGIEARSVSPAGWARVSSDGSHFELTRPGATVTFGFILDGTTLPPSSRRREFEFEATFEDEGGARLGDATIVVVVPADGAADGC